MRPDSWSTSYLFRWPFGISMVTSNSTASFSLRSGDLGSPQCGAWMHGGTKEARVRRVLLASATVLLLLTGYAVADAGNLPPRVLTRDPPAAALAVADGLDLRDTMTTEVAAVPGSTEVVLVASGDTLLAPVRGNAGQVAGRAGLADLARQVADALRGSGRTTVDLRLDLSRAPGPRYPSSWNPNDVRDGFTQAVVMTGLATQLPRAGRPAPREPEQEVAEAFAAALAGAGVKSRPLPRSSSGPPPPPHPLGL